MTEGQEAAQTLVDGRGRAVTTREQSQRLHAAIERRHRERGWPIGERGSSALYYGLAKGNPTQLSGLWKWARRMEWTPDSARRVALDGKDPIPLEELSSRLRRAVEDRCAQRGWEPAAVIPEYVWSVLVEGRLPDALDADALFDALNGTGLSAAAVQALRDVDQALEWTSGSAARLALEGVPPIPLEGDASSIVIRFDAPPGTLSLDEWYSVAGQVTAAGLEMSPEERGRLGAALRQMLREWQERRAQ